MSDPIESMDYDLVVDLEPNAVWKGLPPPVPLSTLQADPPPRPTELIHGLLFKGGKALGSAPSKGRKTWTALHMGICVAAGMPWFGFTTTRANVLFLDLELLPHELPERLASIQRKVGTSDSSGIFVQQLRGHRLSMDRVKAGIIEFCQLHEIGLLIIDPYYKLSGGADEIGTEGVSEFLFNLDEIAREAGPAIAINHHFTKGDSSQKSVIDLASGSGVFGRDPDLIWGIRELKDSTIEQPLVRMEFVVRSFKPVKPIGLRWDFPIWRHDESLDLELKQPGKSGKPPNENYTVENILEILGKKELSVGEWGDLSGAKLGIKVRRFKELKAFAKNNDFITERKEGRFTYCRRTRAERQDEFNALNNPYK